MCSDLVNVVVRCLLCWLNCACGCCVVCLMCVVVCLWCAYVMCVMLYSIVWAGIVGYVLDL